MDVCNIQSPIYLHHDDSDCMLLIDTFAVFISLVLMQTRTDVHTHTSLKFVILHKQLSYGRLCQPWLLFNYYT